MIKLPQKKIPCRYILAGLAACFLVCSIGQAQDTNATALKPTVVTGSYIPTAETVGPAPVDVVTSANIEKIGSQDVFTALKRVSPDFAGNASTGVEINNGGTGESYLLIRNLSTLVLLNGHRLGNSSFSSGSLVDLNTIPLAAIERVEVLKDGASALYGSEAVGGVVNIITKKNYSGVEVGGRYGFATGDGNFTEQRASIVGGTGNESSSFTAAAQWYHRDPLKTQDRDVASLGYQDLIANNLYPGAVSYMSPSFPGKLEDKSATGGTRRWLLRGSPLAKQFFPNEFDPSFKTPPIVPGFVGNAPTAVGDYNTAYLAANPTATRAPYFRIASDNPLLNTTEFGTYTIQSSDRVNVFGTAEHDLFEKRMQVYSDFLYANIESEGALAPSPVTGLGPKQSNISIPPNNLYNPFAIGLGPNYGTNGLPPNGPRVRSRFVDSGNRLFDNQSDYYHFVAGLKGELEGGYNYNGYYNYNRYDQQAYTRNAINGAALELALTPNANPAFAAQGLSQLAGEDGLPVPMYNIFSIGGNAPATVDALRTTLFQSGVSEEWDTGGIIGGNIPLDLPAGKIGFAVGGGFTSESLEIDFDGLTRLGKVPGLNAAFPTSGRRDSWRGFAEVRIPITSPDMDIPALRSLEVTAAGRYETFDPGGDSAVPKVGVRWQPLDEQITLRATYSQSFIAPTTYQLFGGSQVNVPALYLPVSSDPNAAYSVLQEYENNLSNPNLSPVDAENYSAGIVFSPKGLQGLTISVDYYHVETENDIFRVTDQTMVDDINARGSASPWAPYFFRADGSQITTTAINQANDADWGVLNDPLMNGASQKTDGLDIGLSYARETDKYGKFTLFANANVLFSYEYSDPVSGGPFDYKGKYSDANTGTPGAQGTLPEFQINPGLIWEFQDFTYTITARYIPSVDVVGASDFTMDGSGWTVDSWFSIDMQLAYRFGEKYPAWLRGTRVAVGVNNVTDEAAPLIATGFEDNTDKTTYDIIGRFIYFELSKKF